jgi:hypothetical protein
MVTTLKGDTETVHSSVLTGTLLGYLTQAELAIGRVRGTLGKGSHRRRCDQKTDQNSIHIVFHYLLKIISACKIIEKKLKYSLFTEKYKLFLHRETFKNDI